MTPFDIGLLSLLAMGVAVMAGMFVPIALMVCSFVGVWAIKGSPVLASKLLALAANDAISSYFFGVVPLFVLMGFVVSEAGFGRDAFDVANSAFRRLKGGLGVGTVGANAIFAAITGISIASAAVFTKIAVPQMIRHGYTPRFATGVVAGSSVLGMMIPPSLLLILFGILAEQSIGDLFIAGIGPDFFWRSSSRSASSQWPSSHRALSAHQMKLTSPACPALTSSKKPFPSPA